MGGGCEESGEEVQGQEKGQRQGRRWWKLAGRGKEGSGEFLGHTFTDQVAFADTAADAPADIARFLVVAGRQVPGDGFGRRDDKGQHHNREWLCWLKVFLQEHAPIVAGHVANRVVSQSGSPQVLEPGFQVRSAGSRQHHLGAVWQQNLHAVIDVFAADFGHGCTSQFNLHQQFVLLRVEGRNRSERLVKEKMVVVEHAAGRGKSPWTIATAWWTCSCEFLQIASMPATQRSHHTAPTPAVSVRPRAISDLPVKCAITITNEVHRSLCFWLARFCSIQQ